jgi:hypothetical protein
MQRQDSSREATTKQSPSGPNTRIASNKRTSQGTEQQIKQHNNQHSSYQKQGRTLAPNPTWPKIKEKLI